MSRRKNQSRRGAAAVEFALVAPLLFLTIVLPLFEFGRAMMVLDTLANAAQVGCRRGALPGTSTSTITTTVNGLLTGQGISGATTTVSVNGNSGADANQAVHNDVISVQVSVPYGNTTWLPVSSMQYLSDKPLTRTKVMCRE
jgi:Flp pilus assembly protein TadG